MKSWRYCILVATAVATWSSPLSAADQGADQGEVLRIPGLPAIRMPPGVHVEGPGSEGLGNTPFPPIGGRGYDADRADPEGGMPGDHDPGDRDDLGPRRFPRFGRRLAPEDPSPPMESGAADLDRDGSRARGKSTGRPTAQKNPKVLTPAERAAAIRDAMAPKPPLALARRRTLDDLYGKLAAAADADEAKGLATLIGTIWMQTGSDTANLLMQRAVDAIEAKNYPLALQVLDRIVVLQPQWAEAWNKRASVRFFAGDLDGSMADVEHVLKLEPKHFGALEGMATILQRTGFDKRALEVYRRALAVYPHQTEIEKTVDRLTLEVEGQGI